MNASKFVFSTLLLCLVSIPASAQINMKIGKEANKPSICIHSSLMQRFRMISNRHLLFSYDAKNHYLMTLKRTCFGLSAASQVYARYGNQVCSNKFDEIVFEDKVSNKDSCQVDTIDHVESYDAAKDLIKERKSRTKE